MRFDTGLHLPAPDPQLDQRKGLLAELGLDKLTPDEQFDTFATELAHLFRLPYAMVNLITTEQTFVGLHTPSGQGLPAVGRTMPRDHGYCPEVLERGRALILPDVYASPRFAGNAVVDQLGIRTYAGAPLIHQGVVLGTVCVVGTAPRRRETGQESLARINAQRDRFMELLRQRTRR
ncbi:GAF domain-containing protein [Actinomadura viridis]|uniref:GAF domain-containing protein n=1 Tax=Actinomadura viridis TaxID=58110 RepID=UPI0036D02331